MDPWASIFFTPNSPLLTPHTRPPSAWLPLALTLVLSANVRVDGASLDGDWHQGDGFRYRPLAVPASGRVGFTRLNPDQTGVRFTNQLSDSDLGKNQILEVGSGVALGDVDGDGNTDLYFCAMGGANRLYRNLGQWRFEDVTEASGVDCEGQFSTGAVMADVDGDGDLDLLVNGIGSGTRLFMNQGGGRFLESTDSGLSRRGGTTTMTLADIDGDALLDLYVAHYHTRTVKDSPTALNIEAGFQGGRFVTRPPGLFEPIYLRSGGISLFELGETDVLYRNQGGGRFVPVDWTKGTFLDSTGATLTEAPKDWGLAAVFRDLNGDGLPDLYVCNDFFHSLDQLWINEGSGRFRAAAPFTLRHTSLSSMAVDFADIDRDGHDDFLVLDMLSRSHELRHLQRGSMIHLQADTPVRVPAYRPEYPRNMLFRSRGDGTYAEIAPFSGVEASEWSWSVVFLDVDLDGYEDVLIANGTLRDANQADLAMMGAGRLDSRGSIRDKNLRFPPSLTANLAFRNRGDLTFEETGGAWGFDTTGVSHGMALADLDNDGDLDVVINHMRQAAGLYRNDTAAPRVAVRAVGRPPNGQGIGARVALRGGAVPCQTQQIGSGGRYLSGDDPMRVFAAGKTRTGMTLEVTWRNGTTSRVHDVTANRCYEIREPTATSSSAPSAAPSADGVCEPSEARERASMGLPLDGPLFKDVSERLRSPHVENEFDELDRQPTLVRRFSRLGPGLAWRDLDGDGWDDLVVGGARNGFGLIYVSDGQGGFRPTRRREPLTRDQTTVLAVSDEGGHRNLIVGSSNYEDADGQGGGVVAYDLQTGEERVAVASSPGAVGPLAIGLVGRRQALFVGGRLLPGRYPEAVPSQVCLWNEGVWRPETTWASTLTAVGRASGAVWVDLDDDGQLELVVACDWGPVRVFEFKGDKIEERTQALRMQSYVGWWNGVAAGDFDEDGRLDLVASNWGRNGRNERHAAHPIRLYYGDWQGTGRMENLEAYFEPAWKKYVPFAPLDVLRASSPGLAVRFPTFAAYARAGVEEVVGMDEAKLAFLEAGWFSTTLFLNRGDHFEARPLPAEAQWAPAFGVSVADANGDGHDDVFLSQNFFDVDPGVSRHDAGRGLLLLGDGTGRLTPVSGAASGIIIYGEQRGSAFCDFDRDGRVDLAVGQNGGPVGFFRNVGARPGLRIRLRGPAWNRDGIGAVVRLRHEDGLGPARCIVAGSGFGSQEALEPVLGGVKAATGVQVRWPGGQVSHQEILPGQREIDVAYDAR